MVSEAEADLSINDTNTISTEAILENSLAEKTESENETSEENAIKIEEFYAANKYYILGAAAVAIIIRKRKLQCQELKILEHVEILRF